MKNPLEQFQIKTIIPWNILGYDLSFTNSSLMMLLVLFIAALFTYVFRSSGGYTAAKVFTNGGPIEDKNLVGGAGGIDERSISDKDSRLVPTRITALGEMLYDLVCKMTYSNTGEAGERFIPFIFTLYVFVLLCNVLGMIPGAFTVTSHITITFALAAFIFLGVTFIGFFKHGFHYLDLFLPKGTPTILMPLMFFIELFAYLSRPISLSLRLAANMTAGHIVLKVIASFILISGVVGILPFGLLVILTGFEFFIAFLQAYIFSILTCVYLNDALSVH